jgi:hypothetical protein
MTPFKFQHSSITGSATWYLPPAEALDLLSVKTQVFNSLAHSGLTSVARADDDPQTAESMPSCGAAFQILTPLPSASALRRIKTNPEQQQEKANEADPQCGCNPDVNWYCAFCDSRRKRQLGSVTTERSELVCHSHAAG